MNKLIDSVGIERHEMEYIVLECTIKGGKKNHAMVYDCIQPKNKVLNQNIPK